SFDRIDASRYPVIVTSDRYSFLDSLSLSDLPSHTFVLSEGQPYWSVFHVDTQELTIVREPWNSIAIYTSDCRRFVQSHRSRKWNTHKVRYRADEWPEDGLRSKSVPGAVCVSQDALIVGVTRYSLDSTDGPALGSAILVSEDECKSFRVLMSMTGDIEVCGIIS